MLVIHPYDPTTEFLRAIYENMDGVTCLRGEESRKAVAGILYHLPPGETILLLGHGSCDGLFRKEEDGYRCYIGRSMAYSLKRHPVIGIWCHANAFAEAVGLHGLFTGMIISEMQEAIDYGVKTTEEEIARENSHLAESLQKALSEGRPFLQMRNRLVDLLGEPWTELTRFNFKSIYIR